MSVIRSFVDADFVWGDITGHTARIRDVYPSKAQFSDGTQLFHPEHMDWSDMAQGTHPDCFLIGAMTALCYVDPTRLSRLCSSPSLSAEGKYTFRFFRKTAWVDVTCDDLIPSSDGQTPLFARSPSQRWWPLLLEKAYAKFYGGYPALSGGNMAECLHDLTSCPVRTLSFQNKSHTTGVKMSPAMWSEFAAMLEKKEAAICCGTLKSFDTAPGQGHGLQPAHAYAVAKIVPQLGFAVLINPNKNVRYRGPLCNEDRKFTADMRKQSDIDERRADWFAIPFNTLTECFATIAVACLSGKADNLLFAADGEWSTERGTAGGCSTYATYRDNPKFVITNSSPTAVTVWATVKQPEQRSSADDAAAISYLPATVTLVRRVRNTSAAGATASKGAVPVSHYITASSFDDLTGGQPRYVNQRDVAVQLSVPPGVSMLIPATHSPKQDSRFTLLVNGPSEHITVVPLPCVSNDHAVEVAVAPSGTADLVIKGLSDSDSKTPATLHVCVAQVGGATASQGGTVSTHYWTTSLLHPTTRALAESTVGINYTEQSIVTVISKSAAFEMREGAFNVCVQVANLKGKGPMKIRVSAYASGGDVTEMTAVTPAPKTIAEPAPPAEVKPSAPATRPAKGVASRPTGGVTSAPRGSGVTAVRSVRAAAAPAAPAPSKGFAGRGRSGPGSVASLYAAFD